MKASRNDIETTSSCPVCHATFVPVRRQRYDTPACRQAAWRARNSTTDLAAAQPAALPTGSRRKRTVYECTECDQRYLGQQWCDDCVRPCVRVGLGGLCTSCEEPVVVDELLNAHDDDLTAQSRENTPSTKPGAVQ
ncbi:MAG: hypothetical protein ACR2JO_04080 [Mycobacteriales bacterium]